MSRTISFPEYAKLKGVAVMTAYRWAAAGKLGRVILEPGKKRGRRLVVADLIALGLVEPREIDDPAADLALARQKYEVADKHLTLAIRALPDKEQRVDHLLAYMEELAALGSRR
jgi:hypothetical protein